MAAPDPLPTYVYKILPTAPPSPIPSPFPYSELDRADGFVHLSTAEQIPITASLFFPSHQSLWILKIRLAQDICSLTTWETQGCPHLHGEFGAVHVVDSREFELGDGKDWRDRLGGEPWLE